MLMVERSVRHTYSHMLPTDTKMPKKGQTLYLSGPYAPSGVGVWWTDRKSPEGKRLFNCGRVRLDGSQPPLFSD